MRIAFTVSPYRHTVGVFERMAEIVLPVLDELGHVTPWQPEALAWMDWVASLDVAPGPDGFDLVVGFELPRGVRETAPAWIDIRQHPVRFAGEFWSLTGSEDLSRVLDGWTAEIPRPERLAEYGSFGAFACQVSFDAALVHGGRLMNPDDLLPGVRQFAHRFEAVFVCPHPAEPRGPWVDAALAIPNCVPSPWPTYETLKRVRNVCTVTSSVGVEAQYFGVETFWLAQPLTYSEPVEKLSDFALWAEMLDVTLGVAA